MPLLLQRKGRRNATGRPPAYSLRVHLRVPPHRLGAAVAHRYYSRVTWRLLGSSEQLLGFGGGFAGGIFCNELFERFAR